MDVERRFKPGSKRETVFNILQSARADNQPLPASRVIAEQTGLTLRQVKTARSVLFAKGCLTATHEQWREAIAHTRKSIIPSISLYAVLGMSPAEIQEAMVQEKGYERTEIAAEKIANALSHAGRTDRPLRTRTREEIREIRGEVLRRTPEQLSQRVKLWLGLRDVFGMVPESKRPRTRSEWLFLISDREGDNKAKSRLEKTIKPEELYRLSNFAVLLRRDPKSIDLAEIIDQDTSDREGVRLVRLFLEEGLIGSDALYWKCLEVIYNEAGRSLPADFTGRLQLEIYLAAIIQRKRTHQDTTLINKYRRLGEAVGVLWFTATLREEELFIEQDIDRRNRQRVTRSTG